MGSLRKLRDVLVKEWSRLTKDALPKLARTQGGWPIRLDHCFQRVALDAAFAGCWYDHLDRKKGPAIQQIDTRELVLAVDAARRMESGGVAVTEELNRASLRWRGKAGPKRARATARSQ